MDKQLVPVLALALVLCLSIGWCLADDVSSPGSAAACGVTGSLQPLYDAPDVNALHQAVNEKESVSVTLGGLPLSEREQGPTYLDMDAFVEANRDLLDAYFYPEGPVIGFGYYQGYVCIQLWNGPPRPGNPYTVETMYESLSDRAGRMGIDDLPVRAELFASPVALDTR